MSYNIFFWIYRLRVISTDFNQENNFITNFIIPLYTISACSQSLGIDNKFIASCVCLLLTLLMHVLCFQLVILLYIRYSLSSVVKKYWLFRCLFLVYFNFYFYRLPLYAKHMNQVKNKNSKLFEYIYIYSNGTTMSDANCVHAACDLRMNR